MGLEIINGSNNIAGFAMSDEPFLRRRKRLPDPHKHHASSSKAPALKKTPPTRRRTWRFYVRWFARIALPIVFICSNARLVTIPALPSFLCDRTVLLVITHSRASYLNRSLTSVLSYHPRSERWPVVVSQDRQDGEQHANVEDVVSRAADIARGLGIDFYEWAHEISYEDKVDNGEGFVDLVAYQRISRHYYWALRRLFAEGLGDGGAEIQRVVIVEDDMEIASDFYGYFDALTPLLERDETLFCVSAWNDNGIESLALNASQLHRTDFFPGLGWMLTRALWEELEPQWPEEFWDDWLRGRDRTKGRQCVRPEVSRAANFGEKGVSQSFHFKKHVSSVVLAKEWVNFSALDLSYLEADKYHEYIFSRMSKAVQLRFSNYLTTRPQKADVISFYPNGHLEGIGKRTGIMADHRDGLRRTSYKGVIVFPWNGYWAFVVPREWEPPEGHQLGASVCCP